MTNDRRATLLAFFGIQYFADRLLYRGVSKYPMIAWSTPATCDWWRCAEEAEYAGSLRALRAVYAGTPWRKGQYLPAAWR